LRIKKVTFLSNCLKRGLAGNCCVKAKMVTKEEFGQFIAEFESFKDFLTEEMIKLKTEMEKLNETVNDLAKEVKLGEKRIG